MADHHHLRDWSVERWLEAATIFLFFFNRLANDKRDQK